MKLQEAIGIMKIALAEVEWEYPMDYAAAFETAIEALEKQAASEWIPVSEGLPEEEYDTVLVFLESNIYDIAIWTSKHGFRPWYAAYFEEATPEWERKVLAWMPCPEPYKGE